MQELEQAVAPGRAEARREIGDPLFGQVTGDAVQQRVAQTPGRGCLRSIGSRADDEIVRTQVRDEPDRVGRRVLPVGVDDQHVRAAGVPDAGLHRGAVALVVGMPDHAGAGGRRLSAGVVGRSVVDDEDFAPSGGREQVANDGGDGRGLVVGRNDDRRVRRTGRISHGRSAMSRCAVHVAKRKLMMSPS